MSTKDKFFMVEYRLHQQGYAIVKAGDAEEAKKRFRQNPHDFDGEESALSVFIDDVNEHE